MIDKLIFKQSNCELTENNVYENCYYELSCSVVCEKYKGNYILTNSRNNYRIHTQGVETQIISGFIDGKEYFDIVDEIIKSTTDKRSKIYLSMYCDDFVGVLITHDFIVRNDNIRDDK